MANVKFLTGTDFSKLPTYSPTTIGNIYFCVDTTNSDVSKWNGKIIYDSDHGRIVMSTQAVSAEKDIFFNNIIDYLKEAEVIEDPNGGKLLHLVRGSGDAIDLHMCEVELVITEDYIEVAEIRDNIISSGSTYSSQKIEEKLANANGNSLWYNLDGTEL